MIQNKGSKSKVRGESSADRNGERVSAVGQS
jgi:hypothetical protein